MVIGIALFPLGNVSDAGIRDLNARLARYRDGSRVRDYRNGGKARFIGKTDIWNIPSVACMPMRPRGICTTRGDLD
jgi:hypothetical protein